MYTEEELEARRIKIWLNKSRQLNGTGLKLEFDHSEIGWPSYCPAIGIKLEYGTKGKACDSSPSFDRVDPTKGYTLENTRVISNRANRIKNNGSAAELRMIADYIDRELNKE